MVLSVFPKGLYKRLLKASKIIDSTNAQLPFQSLLCGKPSTLYSYEFNQNIEIGTASYSLYDRVVSIMNDGEYSSPIAIPTNPISFYSITRNTARLLSKSRQLHDEKKSMFSKQSHETTLTKSELIEIVTNFESLASIANKYNKSKQNIKCISTRNINVSKYSKNTFQCDIIDLNDKQLTDKHINAQNNIINNKDELILEFTRKTLQSTNGKASNWRNCILFQHPLSTMSTIHNNNNNNAKIEPYVLLCLFARSTHSTLLFSRKKNKENNIRIALMMNGEKTLMQIKDIVGKKQILSTFHGIQNIPEIFYENNLFIGGDDLSTIEILTNNPYCKGVSIMNNKLFWNPDLQIAERIIRSGYGTIDQFRFFNGKMKWNNHLWNNIQERNLYGFASTLRNTNGLLAKQIWSYHVNDNESSLWYQLLELCCKSDTKDIYMQLFNLINQHHSDIQQEIRQLMQLHDAKITQQVKHWANQQTVSS